MYAQPRYKMCQWTFLSCEMCNEVTKLLIGCSKKQKLLQVARNRKSGPNLQKLLKSCRAQSVEAYSTLLRRFRKTCASSDIFSFKTVFPITLFANIW